MLYLKATFKLYYKTCFSYAKPNAVFSGGI